MSLVDWQPVASIGPCTETSNNILFQYINYGKSTIKYGEIKFKFVSIILVGIKIYHVCQNTAYKLLFNARHLRTSLLLVESKMCLSTIKSNNTSSSHT